MSGIYKQPKDETVEEDNEFSAGFELPQTKGVLDSLTEALQQEHMEEEEEDKKQGKPKKQRSGGVICCCHREGCGIGPFEERN